MRRTQAGAEASAVVFQHRQGISTALKTEWLCSTVG